MSRANAAKVAVVNNFIESHLTGVNVNRKRGIVRLEDQDGQEVYFVEIFDGDDVHRGLKVFASKAGGFRHIIRVEEEGKILYTRE